MMATALSDADEVRAALRLGWLISEVRGRARPGGPGAEFAADMARGGWALPLGSERSAAEREVEAEHALISAAKRLKLDWPVQSPAPGDTSTAHKPEPDRSDPNAAPADPAAAVAHTAAPGDPPVARAFSAELGRLGRLVSEQRKAGGTGADTAWREFASLLYRWDARIQDELLSVSDRQANAYELGRALAEMYWALDLGAPARVPHGNALLLNPVSWDFLFGDDRRADISRLLSRLAPFFAPLTSAAIAGSVEIWGCVSQNQEWRSQSSVRKSLLEQTRNWYSLLVSDLDPETLLKPYAGLRSWRIFRRTFRAFGLEMVTGTVGVAALAGFVLLIAYAPHRPVLETVVSALGVLGVTSAGLQARLKATTQSMLARLSADLSTELVAEQITVTPPAPASARAGRERQRAIQSRTVTAPLKR